MMIGRTRVSVGPLRDLKQLDATIARIGRIPGVTRVDVDTFVDRHALLGLRVQRPVDLTAELQGALGAEFDSCAVAADRLEVALRNPGQGGDEILGEVRDADWGTATSGVADGAPASTRATHRAETGSAWADPGAWVDPADSPWSREDDDRAVAAPAEAGGPECPAPVAELLDASFAQAPIATALVAPDGRWLRVNRRLCELLGRDEATLLARDIHELLHPDDLAACVELGRDVRAGSRARYAVDTRWLHADGRVVSTRLEVSPVRAADGRSRWLVLQVIDLSPPAGARARLRLAVAT